MFPATPKESSKQNSLVVNGLSNFAKNVAVK